MIAGQEIAVAYNITVDGFTQLVLKRLRNPRHPAIVWMRADTWEKLATHATRDGEFYIPCREGLLEPPQLRMLVLQHEMTGASDGESMARGGGTSGAAGSDQQAVPQKEEGL